MKETHMSVGILALLAMGFRQRQKAAAFHLDEVRQQVKKPGGG
jgi:hypothetical protein